MKLISIFSLCFVLMIQTQQLFSQEEKQNLEVVRTNVFLNGRLLSSSEVVTILNTNPGNAALYRKGLDIRSNGSAMLWGGIAACVIGFGVMVNDAAKNIGNHSGYNSDESTNFRTGNLVFMLGQGLIAGGIVCRVIGKSKVTKAIRNHNSNFPTNRDMSYSFGIQQNGLGLVVNF